jgi:hypothetical protein
VISVRVTESGFHVPQETAAELGLSPGEEARLEIRRVLDRDTIRNRALHYAWRRLGDAVGVEVPEWDGETWTVRLKVRGCSGDLGALVVSPDGEVLVNRSISKEALLERVNVARARSSAVG